MTPSEGDSEAKRILARSPASSVRPSRFPGDPQPREDGRCVVCERERAPLVITHGDPFCSSTCARKYYGVTERQGIES